MSEASASFGALLQRYREEAGLSIARLSTLSGRHKATIRRNEAGESIPYASTVDVFIAALKLDEGKARALLQAHTAAQREQKDTEAARPPHAAQRREPPAAPVGPDTVLDIAVQDESIVDRAAEVDAILAHLRGRDRLVTLTGPPGVGKSRVALEVARRLGAERTPGRGAGPEGAAAPLVDDVAFRDLATLRDPARVLPEIAAAVGFFEHGPGELRAGLEAHLRERRLLLLLDNVDPVVAAPGPLNTSGVVLGVAPLLAGLVGAVPGLRVLATSREALQVRPEVDHPVKPLDEESALTLFVVSTRPSVPAFRLTTATRGTVDEICARVDRLPLAIQLVAARVPSLAPDQLLDRLGSRLPLLADAAYRGANHHKTMSAAIAWSHDLLDEDARLVFRRLAVFAGGCTVASAEAVCAGGDGLAAPTLAIVVGVERLVGASFVRADGAGMGRQRYAMLEVIREYALARLADSGEEAAVRARHADHVLARADAATATGLAGDRAWFAQEEGNLLAAFDWTLAVGDAGRALPLAIALWSLWHPQGRLTEGRRALGRALALPGGERSWRARALHVASALAQEQGDDDAALDLAERAVALHRGAAPLRHLGNLIRQRGNNARAQELLTESMRTAAAEGDVGGLAAVATMLGVLVHDLGMLDEASAAHDLAHRAAWALGAWRLAATTRLNMGAMALAAGDPTAARWHFDDALALLRELEDAPGSASAAAMLGVALLHGGAPERASAPLRLARRAFRRLDDRRSEAACLVRLGTAALLMGDTRRAAVRHRAGLRIAVAGGLGVVAAEAIEGLAAVAIAREDGARAARFLAAAAAAREAAGTALVAWALAMHDALVGRAIGLADTATYDAEFAAGRGLTPERILADGD